MVEHSGGLWHYLSSFMMYTLTAIAMIYGVYWLIQRAPGTSGKQEPPAEEEKPGKLELESTLTLDEKRTLHVIRTGSERFLLSAIGESTQLLSRLENVPSDAPPPEAAPAPAEVAEEPQPVAVVEAPPWYASLAGPPLPSAEELPIRVSRKSGFADRFVQSVKWLASSRLR